MADIEVVIKIDEDIYNRFTHNEVRPRCEITEEERFQIDADAVRLTRAFCNGTPLPKGQWLRMSDLSEQEDDRYKCSRCGNVIRHRNKRNLYTFNSWCGRCGSDNGRKIEVKL